jgi:hypothetical protein
MEAVVTEKEHNKPYYGGYIGACLICRLWKAWPANQALASQSSVRKGQGPCLMFLHQLSLAEAFFLFDSECGAWSKGN